MALTDRELETLPNGKRVFLCDTVYLHEVGKPWGDPRFTEKDKLDIHNKKGYVIGRPSAAMVDWATASERANMHVVCVPGMGIKVVNDIYIYPLGMKHLK